jgi:hypothetical protein
MGDLPFNITHEKSVLFTVPWFETLLPDPVLTEEFSRAGWAGVLASDNFRVFHRYRLGYAQFPLWGGRPLKEFFPVPVTELKKRGYDDPKHVASVQDSVKSVAAAARTLLTTQKYTYLGSTSASVGQADSIWVIPGCSYPVLLRQASHAELAEFPDATNHVSRWLKVVGECYVEGFMKGEALHLIETAELKAEYIHLL